ncbi:hypothetical protein CUJ89_08470 [Burkholderia pyrrocinia]|uniref:AAA domain-containing protein n=1 Tax=Burkholderia pyrrocinia TaxID=60550 RepID=A0A2Z5MTF0_BURPY|nr:hypothetical protein [Burkholderia pyrrocinia]AXF20509.1 hypothetical protein CUJ89_08470 [Burkholderia pyrrocinia]
MGKQATSAIYFERALFVIAPRNHGKSTTLRSLFLDQRLGRNGKIPDELKLNDDYYLSNERRLYLRLTSPHEADENLDHFLSKSSEKMRGRGRWNFAGPLHPAAYKSMPDAVTTVDAFVNFFQPERVRVALLSPNHQGTNDLEWDGGGDLSSDLLGIDGVEVVRIDVRQRNKNGLLLADFFDFT